MSGFEQPGWDRKASDSADVACAEARRLPFNYREIPALVMTLDVAVILVCAWLGQAFTQWYKPQFEMDLGREFAAAVFVSALFVTTMSIREGYEPLQLISFSTQARATLAAWCGTFLLFASGLFAWRIGETVSRVDLVLFWLLGSITLVAHRAAWRVALPWAMKSGRLRPRRVALLSLVDADPKGLAKVLETFGDSVDAAAVDRPGRELSALVDEFVATLRGRSIDEIFVAADLSQIGKLAAATQPLRVLPIPVTLFPVGALRDLMKQPRISMGDAVAIEVQRAPFSAFELGMKRAVDLTLASAALVVLSPLMAAAAVAVKLESPGPALFRQTRHGFNGRPFTIFKFRTMNVLENGPVISQATTDDPRVTRIGRRLRRYSIDELPQLFNVLSGEMSIVGPRPHATAHDHSFASLIQTYALRHHVKAGITGWAQVNGARGETDTPEKIRKRVELDIWYINHWSLWLDLYIVLRTTHVVFTGRNAH